MRLLEINSHEELLHVIKNNDRAYLLLYKKGSEQSECSLKNLSETKFTDDSLMVCMADVSVVRDIHERYNISSVPVMLEFEKGRFINVLKGCHEPGFYQSYVENALYTARISDKGDQQKRVTVYSTPTCSWCTTLKTHLKKHGIRYSEIDVSKDQHAAREMQQRSGQTGVPQTDIGGQMIVGFDKTRINNLLGIQ
ncbi:MAG: glutaredoxin domain-containing protein [Bacteroidales bacterium]